MTRFAPPLLAAALAFTATGATAQNFFERLFGITPSRPQPPAYNYPPPQQPGPPDASVDDVPRRASPPPPVLARPVTIRAPNEDAVVGRDLKQNGSNGSLKVERAGRGDLRLRLVLAGRKSAQSVETCTIPLTPADGAALVSLGRPEGAPRYQLQDPTCPLQLDVLDEAVLVKGPTDICVFQSAECQADPSGMWGPAPSQLLGKVRDYEAQRAASDKAVRENYKVMTQRAKPEGIRPIVAEQAAFSADRETMCRSYAREGTTSFCNAKFTESRALALSTRLGLTPTGATQSAESRPRRSRGGDPYGIPPTDEIMQRRPVDDD